MKKVIIISKKGGDETRKTTLLGDEAARFYAFLKGSEETFETIRFANSDGEEFSVILMRLS